MGHVLQGIIFQNYVRTAESCAALRAAAEHFATLKDLFNFLRSNKVCQQIAEKVIVWRLEFFCFASP